jgi:hypothetical protein
MVRVLLSLALICAVSAGSTRAHTSQMSLRASLHVAPSLPLRDSVIRLRGGADAAATASAPAAAAAAAPPATAAPAKEEPEVIDPAQAKVRAAVDSLKNR